MTEVIQKYISETPKNVIQNNNTIVVTLHRTENITNKENLLGIINALNALSSRQHQVLLSMHPKLEDMMKQF
ncbi:UDP-N-acetylglucosamine 2-epimerase [Candidatus Peregrinibacteria bacterium]|nr:UDP-N-acetylglucosamine 2-epimerase [Candidatus Peregrinibacteria bacterium]